MLSNKYISDFYDKKKLSSRYKNFKEEICHNVIYIIGDENKNYKIGKSTTKAFNNRIKAIQTGNPDYLETYAVFVVTNPKIENICHKELRKNKIIKRKGEWFQGDFSTIRSIIFQTVINYDQSI